MYLTSLNNRRSHSCVHLVTWHASLVVGLNKSKRQCLAAYKIFISTEAAIGCNLPLSSSFSASGAGFFVFFDFPLPGTEAFWPPCPDSASSPGAPGNSTAEKVCHNKGNDHTDAQHPNPFDLLVGKA